MNATLTRIVARGFALLFAGLVGREATGTEMNTLTDAAGLVVAALVVLVSLGVEVWAAKKGAKR